MLQRRAECLGGCHLPELDGLVFAPGRQGSSIRAEGHRSNRALMAVKESWLERAVEVPKPHAPILTAGHNPPSIRGEGNRSKAPLLGGQRSYALARRHVPESSRSIQAPGQGELAIGTE